MDKYQKWCFPQKVYAMPKTIAFDKSIKSMYKNKKWKNHKRGLPVMYLKKHT